ncbi:hypothetical protein KSS87_011366, partial [Heliosperma pusillum]
MEFTTADDCQDENITSILEVTDFTDFEHRRSAVWNVYWQITPEKSKDKKLRALFKHCKNTNLIAESRYGTTNAKNHLLKCKAYKRTLPSSTRGKFVF